MADRTPEPWPKGGAGETPPGDAKFSTGIEPTGRWGKYPPPGVWNFYTYWHEMKTKWGTVFDGKQTPIEPGRCRYRLGRLQPGQWHDIRFRAIEARVGWGMDGPSLDGDVLDNLKLIFDGAATDRVLLDDFEILE